MLRRCEYTWCDVGAHSNAPYNEQTIWCNDYKSRTVFRRCISDVPKRPNIGRVDDEVKQIIPYYSLVRAFYSIPPHCHRHFQCCCCISHFHLANPNIHHILSTIIRMIRHLYHFHSIVLTSLLFFPVEAGVFSFLLFNLQKKFANKMFFEQIPVVLSIEVEENHSIA